MVSSLLIAWAVVVLAFRACNGTNSARWMLVEMSVVAIMNNVLMVSADAEVGSFALVPLACMGLLGVGIVLGAGFARERIPGATGR